MKSTHNPFIRKLASSQTAICLVGLLIIYTIVVVSILYG